MQPHTEPCPMCGKNEDEYERKREERETKKKEMKAFIIGRRSVTLFSRREKMVHFRELWIAPDYLQYPQYFDWFGL